MYGISNGHSSTLSGEGVKIVASPGFCEWLYENTASLALSTYQAGKVLLVGVNDSGALSVYERTFPNCMGIAIDASSGDFFLATQFQIFRFTDFLKSGVDERGFDSIFYPTQSWFTGDIDSHEIAIDRNGSLLIAATRFNCVGSLADGHSFAPVWFPKFVSGLSPEDRCHLNGLSLDDGKLGYVTCASISDNSNGWRKVRRTGGVIVDARSGDVIVTGLSMPHSPRIHNGRLWVLNSGTGWVGYCDERRGTFIPIVFCGGFARGFSISNGFGIVGLSKFRGRSSAFDGLEIEEELVRQHREAECGVLIFDLHSGNIIASLMFEGAICELFDVGVLQNVRRPSLVGVLGDEIKTTFRVASGRVSLLKVVKQDSD